MNGSEKKPSTPTRLFLFLAAFGSTALPGASQELSWGIEDQLAANTKALGRAVAVDGDRAVIGGEAVFVFVRSGTSWNLEAELQPTTPTGGYGYSVAIRGDTVAVGAPFAAPFNAGSAFVFVRNGTAWSEVAQLGASPPGELLGASVAVAAGGEVLVGVPGKNGVSAASGAVAVFLDDGAGVWSQRALLFASDGEESSELGWSLSASGNTLAVGAPSPVALQPGKAYVFTGSGTSWTEQSILEAADPQIGDQFGASVSVSARTVLVGARYEDEVALNAGAAYVFEPSGTSWSQTAKLTASTGSQADYFGSSVALEGDLAVIGAPSGAGITTQSGVAYGFVRRGTTWTEEGIFFNANAGVGSQFGGGVAVVGSRALVGAPGMPLGVGIHDLRGMAFDANTGTIYGVEPDQDDLIVMASIPGGHVAGPLGFANVQGLAFDPLSNTLYGADIATDQLIVIDTTTGAGTAVGPLGFDQVRALAFDTNTGTLFGADIIADVLVTIDPTTGIGTTVGSLGFKSVQGLAFEAGTNTLYGVDHSKRQLIAIDAATGAGILIGPTGWYFARCLTFDDLQGHLYGFSSTGSGFFLTIDPATGAGTGSSLGAFGLGLVHVIGLGLETNYCTAGTSASGCTASISASGAASASAPSGFTLSATGVEGAKNGFFFFASNGRQANPWGGSSSYQCVAPPVYRAGMMVGTGTAGGCDGALAQDLNAFWCEACPKPAKNPGPGAVVQAQLWYRDPQNPGNQTTSLSNAIEFLVGQ